jgi:hypothetical protein
MGTLFWLRAPRLLDASTYKQSVEETENEKIQSRSVMGGWMGGRGAQAIYLMTSFNRYYSAR